MAPLPETEPEERNTAVLVSSSSSTSAFSASTSHHALNLAAVAAMPSLNGVIDTKGTDPFGNIGDHWHFSRGLSFLDFGVDALVGIFEDLLLDLLEPKISIGSFHAGQILSAKFYQRLKLMNYTWDQKPFPDSTRTGVRVSL